MKKLFCRWLKFSIVGAGGIAVQLGSLGLLVTALGVHYLVATALAVEASVLHNFIWHQHWTWRERTRQAPGVLRRLLRFHAANGLISLGGNVLFMRLFVGELGVPLLVGNLMSIAGCGLLNFAAGEWVVFRAGKAHMGPAVLGRAAQRSSAPLSLPG